MMGWKAKGMWITRVDGSTWCWWWSDEHTHDGQGLVFMMDHFRNYDLILVSGGFSA